MLTVETSPNYKTPIMIGITGHRDIHDEHFGRLKEIVRTHLLRLKEQYPNSPITVLSSLAAGADQLCAGAALDAGCNLIVPLPMDGQEYRKDFSASGALEFDRLCSLADDVFVVPLDENAPAEPGRGFYYRQAGLYVSKRSHILLALWDGTPTLYPEGGGTYETVDFVLRPDGIDDPGSGVWHIVTPRKSNPNPTYESFLFRELGSSARMLQSTERFNADIQKHYKYIDSKNAEVCSYIVDEKTQEGLTSGEKDLLHRYAAADTLSMVYRDKRLLYLRILSGLGLLLVLFFLFYDELESDLMLPIYAICLVCAFAFYAISKRGDYHQKYLEYRMLAEGLRVNLYLMLAGIHSGEIEQMLSEQAEIGWVKKAFYSTISCSVDGEISPEMLQTLKKYWIEGQASYHKTSVMRKTKQYRANGAMTTALLCLSVLIFLIVLILEFLNKDFITLQIDLEGLRSLLMIHEGQAVTLRGIFKILLGIVSATAAFLANYYGKLSLSLQIKSSVRMERLYKNASKRLQRAAGAQNSAEIKDILLWLGKEELNETGGWLGYTLDQSPDIAI